MRGVVPEEIHFLSVEFYLILVLEIHGSCRNVSKRPSTLIPLTMSFAIRLGQNPVKNNALKLSGRKYDSIRREKVIRGFWGR